MTSSPQPPAPAKTNPHGLPPRLGSGSGGTASNQGSFATCTLAWLSGRSYRWVGLLLVGLLAPAVLILFWLDPGAYPIYPVCYFHRVTGWLCPACGSLRALHQLLHGHWAMAWRFNPLLVTALPFVIAAAAWMVAGRGRRGATPFSIRPIWLWLLLVVALGFGVWRNLPGSPPLPITSEINDFKVFIPVGSVMPSLDRER